MNLLRTFRLQNNYIDKYDYYSDILEVTSFAFHITYHNKLQATTRQLVFGREMILNAPFVIYWEAISRR